MKAEKKTFFETIPSAVLAILLMVLAFMITAYTDSLWTPRTETGLKSHIINDLIISSGCFFIVRLNPKSFWYVPLISNAMFILSSLDPKFWKSSMVIPICGGWILSFLVSVLAAKLGNPKRKLS